MLFKVKLLTCMPAQCAHAHPMLFKVKLLTCMPSHPMLFKGELPTCMPARQLLALTHSAKATHANIDNNVAQ